MKTEKCGYCDEQLPDCAHEVTQSEVIEVLKFISHGHTIPGWRGSHSDERIAILQEVIHAAQTKAKELLAKLEAENEH